MDLWRPCIVESTLVGGCHCWSALQISYLYREGSLFWLHSITCCVGFWLPNGYLKFLVILWLLMRFFHIMMLMNMFLIQQWFPVLCLSWFSLPPFSPGLIMLLPHGLCHAFKILARKHSLLHVYFYLLHTCILFIYHLKWYLNLEIFEKHYNFESWMPYISFIKITSFDRSFILSLQAEMQRFVTKIVNLMREEMLFSWQGGPIIMLQVDQTLMLISSWSALSYSSFQKSEMLQWKLWM